MSKKKNLTGIVYSTNPDYIYKKEESSSEYENATLKQELRIWLESKPGGKVATIIKGFSGTEEQLIALGKMLKSKCGVGGTAKDREILLQGNHREKVLALLIKEGYKAKLAGG